MSSATVAPVDSLKLAFKRAYKRVGLILAEVPIVGWLHVLGLADCGTKRISSCLTVYFTDHVGC